MDYYLDIIISKQDIEKVGLTERLCEWGGEKYSCNPAQYYTNTDIEFVKIEKIDIYSEIVDMKAPENFIGLSLKSDIINDLEYAINSGGTSFNENSLFLFLKQLSGLDFFYVFLLREDEKIKEAYEIKTGEDICAALLGCLKWSNPKDIMFFKNIYKNIQ